MPLVFGYDLCHPVPENWRMIFNLRMYKFVYYHIIDHLQRRQYQPPGKTERSLRTARPPARAGRRDVDLSIDEIILIRMKGNALRNHRQSLGLVPTDEDLPGFRDFGICQMEPVTAEGESGTPRRNDGQWVFFSQV